MSWRDLPSLLTHLSALASLLREQNALTRELIQIQTGRPARTLAPSPTERPKIVPRTATDTFVMTPERRAQSEIEAEKAKRRGPGETASRPATTATDPATITPQTPVPQVIHPPAPATYRPPGSSTMD